MLRLELCELAIQLTNRRDIILAQIKLKTIPRDLKASRRQAVSAQAGQHGLEVAWSKAGCARHSALPAPKGASDFS